ncbi:MAG: extracellular solute-binding protein, partial [Anaerolineales bacterium]|nr:extracellular solute-binding protein [Anaerolineales bacterium]
MKAPNQPSFYLLLIFIVLFAGACTGLSNPPRLATTTAQAALPATPTSEPLIIAAPTTTAVSSTNISQPTDLSPNPVLSVWVNETSRVHEVALKTMMDEFTAEYNIDVELMMVSPMLLPELVNTAVVSATLPHIIIHPIEYTAGWAERGYFDIETTTAVLDQLGRDTFDPAALELVNTSAGPTAIPIDGYQQLLIYRKDWVAANRLSEPNNYEAMFALAEATFDLENRLTTGFVIPTESNLVTTHQVFEQIAAANGCELIDENGEVLILEPACQDALNFYYDIVHQFSPPGVQTDTSTRNAYLSGRTGMIMTSPRFLPQLAGLDPNAQPSCPECVDNPTFLIENSGILTTISGYGSTSANFGAITSLGITREADAETAVHFADYWFNTGYPQWLAVESERKVPMRWGT